MNNSKGGSKLQELAARLSESNFVSQQVLRIDDFYGQWGVYYAFHVGPFLAILPVGATILMFYVFRRKNLLGVTQKFILSIMTMAVLFTTTSALRDSTLRILQMHYGFLEYRVCAIVFVSFRLQIIFHATSLWLNTFMLIHQVLVVGFPLKIKLFNLSAFVYGFFLFHFAMCFSFFLLLTFPSFKPVSLIQEFRPGFAVKRIEGCDPHSFAILDDSVASELNRAASHIILIYTKAFPLVLNIVSITCLIVLLTKQIRAVSVLVHNVSVKRVKYLVLMKVNIGLGVSCILQELPVIGIFFYQFAFYGQRVEAFSLYTKYFGIATTVMSISFVIGKPLDLLIYSSLSRIFKEEMKQILGRGCIGCGRSPKHPQLAISKGVALNKKTSSAMCDIAMPA